MDVYVVAVCSDHESQKKASDPQQLELQTVVSLHVVRWELSPDPLEKQPVLLAIESSFQPLLFQFVFYGICLYFMFSISVLRLHNSSFIILYFIFQSIFLLLISVRVQK